MSPSYLLKSQLSEKQIEADVSFYLGWCSNEMPFRLLDIDEQETGADKLFDGHRTNLHTIQKVAGSAAASSATAKAPRS
ncbi:hypothetical protein QD357_15545 [Rhizobium sp. BR 317]|uniref:hypothetical protein n=1 Tax=Rhizobium sp. BR 317 TaxID=3040015 RepID=UPI0039BF2B8D